MAGPALRERLWSADEFMRFEGEADTRHELIDGQIVAMAPAADAHGTITGNVWGEITARLDHRPPCRAIVEAGIRLDERNHFKADVAATCTEPKGDLRVEEPVLVVEVLSPTTFREDAHKVRRYVELPSVQEIWLVDSRERYVQVRHRAADGFVIALPVHGSGTARSDALGDEIALDRLRNTSL